MIPNSFTWKLISKTSVSIFSFMQLLQYQFELQGANYRSRLLLTLVGQRMAIRLMRLDGDDSRAKKIYSGLSICLGSKKKGAESEDD